MITVSWPRNERGVLTGLKTTSYAENAVLVDRAAKQGATEAIVPNTKGDVCEGTGSNIFYVLDGEVVTPTLDSGCLAGITRALLMEWAHDEVSISVRDAHIEVLTRVDEAFLVSSVRDVQPIDHIDGRPLTAPGDLTKRLDAVWTENFRRSFEP